MDTAVLITTNCPASSPSPPIFCAIRVGCGCNRCRVDSDQKEQLKSTKSKGVSDRDDDRRKDKQLAGKRWNQIFEVFRIALNCKVPPST